MQPIITSMLDSDYYKITMQQCVFHQYPNAFVRYTFKCRNKGLKLGFLADEVREQVKAMKCLYLTNGERSFLTCGCQNLFVKDYITYLKDYRYNPSQVDIRNFNGELEIDIDGPWVEAIMWEVPVLAIVNELYFRTKNTNPEESRHQGMDRLNKKIEMIREYPNFKFIEFGTRRRFSGLWQKTVTERLSRCCPNQLTGTSNVKLAMDLGLEPKGTMAHEFISAHLALVDDIKVAQKRAIIVWLQEYGQKLGIALSDTFTTKAFFKDFDWTLANAYAGVRQDSGDPIIFGKQMVERYRNLGIDPRTKTIIFSDGLDIPKALEIYKEFTGLVGLSFGIGTNLTNDVGLEPLNIVIKLVECNHKPVVKLSDNVTKAIGDSDMVKKVREAFGV